MAKIKLGSRPKNFKRVVKFPMVEGGEGSLEVIYKYRTRAEFGVFIDALMDAAKVKPETGDDGEVKFSMKDLMEKTAGANAEYILQVLDGWNLTDEEDKPMELSADNLRQLADEIPAAAAAIMEEYRAAITEGKAKN